MKLEMSTDPAVRFPEPDPSNRWKPYQIRSEIHETYFEKVQIF